MKMSMQSFLHGGLGKTILAGATLAFLLGQASASVIDRPFFRANALVIIFSGGDFVENDGEAPLVHDFVLLDNVASGTEGNDLIAQQCFLLGCVCCSGSWRILGYHHLRMSAQTW